MSMKRTAPLGSVLLAKGLLMTTLAGCGGSSAPDTPATPANIPGREFSVQDEYKNKDKLKDAIPKTK